MKPRRLLWHLFPANILTILAAICLISWYGATTLQNVYLQEAEKDLKARAVLLRPKLLEILQTDDHAALRHYCMTAGRESATRISLIAADGTVLADSQEQAELMENHRARQEVAAALSGETGFSRHFSRTVGEQMIYVAIPLHSPPDNAIRHVLRTSASADSLQKAFQQILGKIVLASLAVLLLAGLVTLIISRNVSRPLEMMTRSARRFAQGNFDNPMLPAGQWGAATEVRTLAAAMDHMGVLLAEKIDAIVSHRNQLETVFSSMVEAVIAIDENERIISLNEAAGQLFSINYQQASGRLMYQVVRHVGLQQKIARNLSTREAEEGEISLHDGAGIKYLQSHVVSLRDGQGRYAGVLIVLNDVTRLRQLEVIRRDFVANVSHELRTPVTSIQGYVETLLDGAMDDSENTRQFLQIVLRQAQRLTAIFDDLLALSRIENESYEGTIIRKKAELLPVIQEAIQTCELKAKDNEITLDYICPPELTMEINSNLIAQALVNLIVNGITYSEKGGMVTVEATLEKSIGEEVYVVVSDNGRGIAQEHLPRLFERFYRSDKARSRTLGGTGLGLAIVKHIVQAHDGCVSVESVQGEGTTFTLIFPKKRPKKNSDKKLDSEAEMG